MSTAGAKRKRSGGIRQRLAEIQRDEAAETYGNESVLAKFLLELFAWGEMSPQLLQRICSLACEDFERANKNPQVLADLSMLAAASAHWIQWNPQKQVPCRPHGKSGTCVPYPQAFQGDYSFQGPSWKLTPGHLTSPRDVLCPIP